MLLLQGPDLGELSQPGSPYNYLDVTFTRSAVECCSQTRQVLYCIPYSVPRHTALYSFALRVMQVHSANSKSMPMPMVSIIKLLRDAKEFKQAQ